MMTVGLVALVQLKDPMYFRFLTAMTLSDTSCGVGRAKVLTGFGFKPSMRERSGGNELRAGVYVAPSPLRPRPAYPPRRY